MAGTALSRTRQLPALRTARLHWFTNTVCGSAKKAYDLASIIISKRTQGGAMAIWGPNATRVLVHALRLSDIIPFDVLVLCKRHEQFHSNLRVR